MRRALVLVQVLLWVTAAGVAPAAAAEWVWPVGAPPAVSRPYDPPTSRYGAGHRGVDLAATPGATVRAAGAGRVSYAGLLAGRGVVVVSHGELRTTYEPVTASVVVGQSVAMGAVLGRLQAGHLGCDGPACLHWGLRRGEAYLDPVRLVRGGPLRLLPLAPAAPRPALRDAAASVDPEVAPVPRPSDVREPGVGQRDRTEPEGAEPQGADGAWSLRAAEAPLGVAAVAALVLGIGLLARPRPFPPDPVSGGSVGAPAASVIPDDAVGRDALLLDLAEARLRRRAG